MKAERTYSNKVEWTDKLEWYQPPFEEKGYWKSGYKIVGKRIDGAEIIFAKDTVNKKEYEQAFKIINILKERWGYGVGFIEDYDRDNYVAWFNLSCNDAPNTEEPEFYRTSTYHHYCKFKQRYEETVKETKKIMKEIK